MGVGWMESPFERRSIQHAMKVRDHAGIQARSIAVIVPVHLAEVVTMLELEQAAAFLLVPDAFDEPQGTVPDLLLPSAREDTG